MEEQNNFADRIVELISQTDEDAALIASLRQRTHDLNRTVRIAQQQNSDLLKENEGLKGRITALQQQLRECKAGQSVAAEDFVLDETDSTMLDNPQD